jgi:enoyl-[acyl-carrier protein] reductase I
MVDYVSHNAPLTEPLQPEDVGHTAAFLSSSLAAGITGTVVYVDKGYHAMGMGVVDVGNRESGIGSRG